MTAHRILVVAHGHPDFSLGGGETAAYNLFQGYRAHADVEHAWFLARHDRRQGATGQLTPRRTDEYLWQQGIADWFDMRSANVDSMFAGLADLLTRLRPTVVHLHHFAHLGLEVVLAIRRILPDVTILLTLHEMMAICCNDGQMVKPGSLRLCSRESLDDCVQCFPDRTIEAFWLRKHRFRSTFRAIDHFVAPSEFLRQRYIAWGLAPDRITVLENAQVRVADRTPRPLAPGETRNRFGFFGQITPYKGVDVLLAAVASLPAESRRGIVVEIHGANLEGQPEAFRTRVEALRAPLIDEGVLRWVGPYEPAQLGQRMRGVDWVVVPSVWWENSPMVIQEAFMHGRPVIASDIGGPAEKVRDGVDGRHVPVGSIAGWSTALQIAAGESDGWLRLREGIRLPPDATSAADEHVSLMARIGAMSTSVTAATVA